MTSFLLAGVATAGVVLIVLSVLVLSRHRRARAHGRLRASDIPGRPGTILRSPRYRLAGRPDELRELADGRWIPVEIKSCATPKRGPLPAHRLQVGGYCLLVEESTGRSPPYGVLRYADGGEFRIPWSPELRAELLGLRREMDVPYDGRASPSPRKCARCGWRHVCDRSAA